MKQLAFRKAHYDEIDKVLELYNELLDDFEKSVNYPRWTKGYYPNKEYLEEKFKKGELFIAINEDKIVSSIILNHDCINDYYQINWTKDLDLNEVLFMHTFALRSNLRGQGIGKEVLDLIKEYCINNDIKSLRCDTINGNTPAEHFYIKNGFNHLGVHELHYEETPERLFNLYEINL